MQRVNLRSLGIALLLLITISVWGNIAEAGELKPGTPNTITLSSGEVVYDLNGEWPGIFEGEMGIFDEIVKITQKGNKFVGIKLLGTSFLGGKDKETIKGVLEKDHFKKIYFYYIYLDEWVSFKGRISKDGNKIDLSGEDDYGVAVKISLSRK